MARINPTTSEAAILQRFNISVSSLVATSLTLFLSFFFFVFFFSFSL
jgi:hypothetical protein